MKIFRQRKKIGEILTANGAVTPQQLEEALKTQVIARKMLGEILIEQKAITEELLYAALSQQHEIEFVRLEPDDLNYELIKEIPESLIKTYKFIPLRKEANSLIIAVYDPVNIRMFDSIKMATGYSFIKWVLATKSQILHIINDVIYRPKNVLENIPIDELLRDVQLEFSEPSNALGNFTATGNLEALKRESDQTAIVTLVHKIILDAVQMGASDIHIESFETMMQVRYRVDGILYDILPIEKNAQQAIISRIKIMSNMDITERYMPQDGNFKLKVREQQIEFRVAILPSVYGENCTLRILDSGKVNLDLKNLGFDDENLAIFARNISKPWGLCLIAGPTGSGKTTTLYSALSLINTRQKKLVTIEDPVEFRIPGVHQMQVRENRNDPSRSLTFARGLRSILRLDPDVILVGEIRDLETAEITVKASLTGHMVFSTIHANSAVEIITRLNNIGVDPSLYASALNVMLSQRLVKKVCTSCKTQIQPAAYAASLLGVSMEELKKQNFLKERAVNIVIIAVLKTEPVFLN
ncbi:MAG: Flp pilus assembly complex ATPase component TadA [Candidatus Riflebacteria bacterium]|nr:Flp pilus assembly complex ATPase component TadA [Candidatus Riflebacteria bacterium]